jgi:hypothetical protein
MGGSPVVGLPFVGNSVNVSTVALAGTVAITDETIVSTNLNFAIVEEALKLVNLNLQLQTTKK